MTQTHVLRGVAPLLALAALLMAPVASAQPETAMGQRLDQIVAAGAPGAVALVDDGGRRGWLGAGGVADLRTGRPMHPHDRFRAGSTTKSFVATVVLQLVDEGRLSLTDTVERWLPGVLPYGDRVEVRQLLNHTSGVPDNIVPLLSGLYRGDRFRSWEPDELVALVADRPQEFAAGSRWSYSNTGYVLAGMIVERVTGHDLGHELERRIFRPLRLRDTSFPVHSPFIGGRHAKGYTLDRDSDLEPVEGPLLDFTVYEPSLAWAAGNLVSDIDDIARFYAALLGGRLLSPARLAEMKTTVATKSEDARYGLGLWVRESPCGPVFGNDGDIVGFSNTVLSSEDGTRQVGLMINAQAAPAAVDGAVDEAIDQAIREAFAGAPCPTDTAMSFVDAGGP
jgi:D-alanyl-D-alanine carboxypeptidase